MKDKKRREFLTKLGLNPDADTLAPVVTNEIVVDMEPEAPARLTPKVTIKLAPEGKDPRTMDVDEIVFDEHLLDNFPSLEGDGLAAASAYVFQMYKSHGRDKHRNGMLHRKITTFITQVRRSRETGGMVKERIKTTKADRDLAALLASQGVDAATLAKALTLLAEQEATK